MKASAGSPLLSCIGAVLLMLPVVYVGTWPMVERRFTKTTTIHFISSASTGSMTTTFSKPAWIDALYAPLHAMRDWNGGNNPVNGYWKWCGGP